jgi:Uma2 family endonuclease
LIDPPDVLSRHRLTVADYHRMSETGVLPPDARVELIEGEVLDLAPMRSRHASMVGRLSELFAAAFRGQALVWCQLPLHLGDYSEPEPDFTLLRPRADYYADALPTAADVQLLVEVSDTTARYDRGIKLALYARHGVQEVWIVDLDNHMLRTYRKPVGEQYTEVIETASPGVLSPQALPHTRIDLRAVLA